MGMEWTQPPAKHDTQVVNFGADPREVYVHAHRACMRSGRIENTQHQKHSNAAGELGLDSTHSEQSLPPEADPSPFSVAHPGSTCHTTTAGAGAGT